MQQIQLIHDELVDKKTQAAHIRKAYAEGLKQIPEYIELIDKAKTIREKKKQIENRHKEDFASELTKLDALRIDISTQAEALADATLAQYLKGEAIEVKDMYDNKYSPVFSVKFKKE